MAPGAPFALAGARAEEPQASRIQRKTKYVGGTGPLRHFFGLSPCLS